MAPTADPPGRFYAPELDGLRFLAALAVFWHHAPPVPGLGALHVYGWAGVDLFLVISAYLLTRLMMLEFRATGRIALRAFFIRRALRVWPLYLGYVTAMTLVAVASGRTTLRTATYWWLSHVGFSNNLVTAVKGYSTVPLTSHLWTISLEEQAYLVLPLMLAACLVGRVSRRGVLATAAATIVLLMVTRTALVMAGVAHPFIWVLPLRADGIVLGVAAALALERPDRTRANLLLGLGIAALLAIGLFPSIEEVGGYQVVGYTMGAIGCCALVMATQGHGMALNRLLGSPPMRLLGKVSFGFYVYHVAMLFVAGKLADRLGPGLQGTGRDWVVIAVALALAIGVAILSYTVYERPFLKHKARFTVVKSRPI